MEELFASSIGPGRPEGRRTVVDIARPDWVGLDRDQWGLDHGTWSVLAHLYPQADVPVVQLSLNAFKPAQYHVQLGARLAALRDRGVLVVASGNVVHNLPRVDWRNRGGEDWTYRFDDAAVSRCRRGARRRDGAASGLRWRAQPDTTPCCISGIGRCADLPPRLVRGWHAGHGIRQLGAASKGRASRAGRAAQGARRPADQAIGRHGAVHAASEKREFC